MFSCIFFPEEGFSCVVGKADKKLTISNEWKVRVRGHKMGEKSVRRDDCQNQW